METTTCQSSRWHLLFDGVSTPGVQLPSVQVGDKLCVSRVSAMFSEFLMITLLANYQGMDLDMIHLYYVIFITNI